MKYRTANETLNAWAAKGRVVFAREDLRKMFGEGGDGYFRIGLKRLTDRGLLERVAHNVYIFRNGIGQRTHLLEQIATFLRRGEHNYLSLESALSEHGVISQIPTGRITVMTTGRKGEFETPYGIIEFTHTARKPNEILDGTIRGPRPLPIAKPHVAYRDLRRVGRNLHLIDEDVLEELLEDHPPSRRAPAPVGEVNAAEHLDLEGMTP